MPQIEIIYQDNNLLIVNKLAGQIVNILMARKD